MNKIGQCYQLENTGRWFFKTSNEFRGVACKTPSVTTAVLNIMKVRIGYWVFDQIRGRL